MIKFENKTNGRFFYLLLSRDLLGDCVLSVLRGGNANNKNVTVFRTIAAGSSDLLTRKIQSITKKRLSRGYTLVSN